MVLSDYCIARFECLSDEWPECRKNCSQFKVVTQDNLKTFVLWAATKGFGVDGNYNLVKP